MHLSQILQAVNKNGATIHRSSTFIGKEPFVEKVYIQRAYVKNGYYVWRFLQESDSDIKVSFVSQMQALSFDHIGALTHHLNTTDC